MKDLAIIVNARKNSQRCKNKLLRPFHDTTILDIVLNKLNTISNFSCYLAAGEDEIVSKLENYQNVSLIQRSYDELNSDFPLNRIYKYHERIEHEWVMFLNPCLVFLNKDTIEQAAQCFIDNDYKALTAVKKNHNWFYDSNMNPINNKDPRQISTKTSPWVYEVCHAFHIYKREFLLKHNSYWNHSGPDDPFLYEISEIESIDIDTETEFLISENTYKSLYHECMHSSS